MLYNHKDDGKQLISFNNLVYGKLYPSDLDAFLDLKGKGWMIYEVKRKGVEMRTGQRLALERLVEDLSHAGKYVVCALGEHEVYDRNEPIDLAACTVTEIKNGTRPWKKPSKKYTMHEITNRVVKKVIDNGNML